VGTFYVDQREVINTSVGTVRRALKKALGERAALPVVISADARTPHQSVITAMDAASRAGLYQIVFSTAKSATATP
jgi:biopolymer transport protein ExbD